MSADRKFLAWLLGGVLALALPVPAHMPGGDRITMRMAMIQEYEERAKNEKDEDKRKTADAMVQVLFRELASDFRPEEMREYALVRVGDYLRTKTKTPDNALVYYDEVIGRKDRVYRLHALWGRADVYGRSSDAEELAKAIEDYDRIAREAEEPAKRELALFRKISLLVKARAYAKAAAEVEIHLDHDRNCFGKYRPGVDLLNAMSYDRRGMENEALTMYSKVISSHMGNIPVSTTALTRWMELMWQRNQPGDRQAAYEAGLHFIGLSPRFKEKLTADEWSLWETVKRQVRNYETDQGIRKIEGMEEIHRVKE